MAVAVTRMSADEYLAGPETRPGTTELVNGTVVVNEPELAHVHAQGEVFFALSAWSRTAPGRGLVSFPADVRIDDANVFAPDVWWLRDDRRPAPEARRLDGVPDLVVEVRSPSTWSRDLTVKLAAYEAKGAAEAWYVDTAARTVLVFRRSTAAATTFDERIEVAGDDALTSPMLPGFALRIGAIFER
ncbi:MAG: Uma2 family endonuclease [Acidimicrobiales bacterium]